MSIQYTSLGFKTHDHQIASLIPYPLDQGLNKLTPRNDLCGPAARCHSLRCHLTIGRLRQQRFLLFDVWFDWTRLTIGKTFLSWFVVLTKEWNGSITSNSVKRPKRRWCQYLRAISMVDFSSSFCYTWTFFYLVIKLSYHLSGLDLKIKT